MKKNEYTFDRVRKYTKKCNVILDDMNKLLIPIHYHNVSEYIYQTDYTLFHDVV